MAISFLFPSRAVWGGDQIRSELEAMAEEQSLLILLSALTGGGADLRELAGLGGCFSDCPGWRGSSGLEPELQAAQEKQDPSSSKKLRQSVMSTS